MNKSQHRKAVFFLAVKRTLRGQTRYLPGILGAAGRDWVEGKIRKRINERKLGKLNRKVTGIWLMRYFCHYFLLSLPCLHIPVNHEVYIPSSLPTHIKLSKLCNSTRLVWVITEALVSSAAVIWVVYRNIGDMLLVINW